MNRVARTIILIIAVPVFLFSSIMVLKYHSEMRNSIEHAETVAQMVVSYSETASESIQPGSFVEEESYIAPTQTAEICVEPSPTAESIAEYSDDICPIQVDFDVLCKENADVIAWIYCPDTPINYPVVQAVDNDYYLHRLLDGRNNSSGTLFMDYRNSADLSDWNSIIYGHNMKNGTMFGYLPHYKQQSYFEEHPKIFLLTPEQNYVIEVMAGFVTQADSEVYSDFCPDEEKKEQLIQNWFDNSDFVTDVNPSSVSKFITLSTCSYEYDNARYVLVGILKKVAN